MKNLPFIRQLFFCCLLISGFLLPGTVHAQTVTINGPINVCVGDVKVYVPGVINPDYTYQWTVTPGGSGTVLSGNSSGATVQWNTPGSSSVNLTIRNPLAGNVVIYTGTRAVTVAAAPSPHITADITLGCQPLNDDTTRQDGRRPEFDDEHCQLVCSNSLVKYTANGNPGSTYAWVVTGAISYTPTTGPTCDVNWGAPGFGQVRLIETTSSGCVAEASFCVEIVQGPQANLVALPPGTPNPIPVCLNGELVVQDASTADPSSPIVSYLWRWGDGDQSTMSPGAAGTPMTHSYANPGLYTVTLTVMNSCGCTSTFARQVRVFSTPAPKITCPRVVCEGERSVYTVDIPCAASSWSVDGGTIVYADPSRLEVVWNSVDPNTGFGYVRYRSCNPCPMTVVEAVPVILRTAVIQGPSSICEGQQYIFRLPKWPSTDFQWTISGPGFIQITDQRNEIAVTSTGPGTITLTCKYNNTVLKCGGSSTKTITVVPQVAITGPALLCQGTSGTYSVAGYTGSWTLRNSVNTVITSGSGTSFSYTFSTPGKYRLSVTGAAFCPPEDYLITVVGIPAIPNIITGPTRACPGIPIRYDAGNPVAGTTFSWSATGGGTVTASVGDYSYVTFGTLPANVQVVRVTTEGANCRSAALSYPVDVAVPPLTITGDDTVCHSTYEPYALNYLDGDFYEWSISAPTLGSVTGNVNSPNPTILWNVPPGVGAVATITGKVKKCNTYYTTTKNVYVRGIPNIVSVSISPNDTVCSGTPITLNISTTYPVTSATSYTINWGDAMPVTIPGYTSTPGHTYITTGSTGPVIFNPAITITDPNGCLGTATGVVAPITIMPPPAALISPSGPLVHCPASGWSDLLTATVTTGIGGSNTYAWSPAISTGTTATATAYGNYSVTVTNSVFGCSSTSNTVSIVQNCGGGGTGCGTGPTINLTAGTANCGNMTVNATVTGTYTSFSWILPTGVSASGTPTATTLNATATVAGVYTIRYRAYYGSGCYTENTINVLVPYIPNLRYSLSCNQAGGNYYVTLLDNSTMYTPISSRTYFRSPSTSIPSSSGGMQAVTTQAGGTTETYYQVIQGGGMAACTSYVTVTTPAFPTVDIVLASGVPNPGCVQDVVFNFNILSMTGSISGYLWNYAPALNYNSAGSVVYTTAGTRNVTLKVTDVYGCTATDAQSVNVQANPYLGSISAAPNPACQGSPVTLTYSLVTPSITFPTSYTWYNETTPVFTTTTPNYNVFDPGGYWVQGIGNFGCQVETNLTPVRINQIPPVSISGNTGQCVNQPFTLTTQSYSPGYTYSWSGAGTGTGTSLVQTKNTPGTYTYFVTITDVATGCSRTSPAFTVTVYPPPAPPSLSFNILNCDPYALQLTATGAAGTYNWSNGMSGTTINTPFGGAYQVTLTDVNGCQVDNSFDVPKSLEEYIWIFPTGCFCKPLQGAYVLGPLVSLNYWAWIRNGGVAASGSGMMPSHTLVPGNVYNMLLNNGYCSLTSGDMYYQSDTCSDIATRPAPAGGDNGFIPGNNNVLADFNSMRLAPNPASINTIVQFRFAQGSTNRSIELIDMTGRRLQTFEVKTDDGQLTLPLEKYAAGMYQVVMRRDGIIVEHSKLSLTR